MACRTHRAAGGHKGRPYKRHRASGPFLQDIQRELIIRALPLPLLLLSLAGCGERASDSASAAGANRWATLTEEARIDGHLHDLVPFDPMPGGTVAVAKDGTVGIAQAQDHVVRFFGPAGESRGEFGGKGEGPGEFEDIRRIGWVGDSLWIHDAGLRRVTVLTPGRELARTVLLGRESDPGSELAESLSSILAWYPLSMNAGNGGTALLMAASDGTLPVDEVLLASVNGQGKFTRVITDVPLGETQVHVEGAGSASLPLTNRTVLDAAGDGHRLGFARAEVEGDTGTVAVHLFGSGGDTIFSRRFPIELVPLSEAVRDSVYDRWIAQLPSILGNAVRERAGEPTHYPPLDDLIVGRDGTVWIALANRERVRPHLVLDPDGDPIGELLLGERGRIAEAERDRIWVIEKDDYDVESLVTYAVTW